MNKNMSSGVVPMVDHVKSQTPLVVSADAYFCGNEFRGEALGMAPAISITGGSVIFERCKFINTFRNEIRGGQKHKFINCEFIFERSVAHPPSAKLSQFGLYIGGGKDIEILGAYMSGHRLDALKPALNTSNIKIAQTTVEDCGVSPEEATRLGCTSVAGDGIDTYGSGNIISLTDFTARSIYGAAFESKTNVAINPGQGIVGDIQITNLYAEDVAFGISHENIDALDHPTGPDFPGIRPDAQRITISGAIIKRPLWYGAFLNGRHLVATGLHILDAGREGIVLYVSARDVDLIAPHVVGCSKFAPGKLPGITIKGAQDCSIVGGVIDGDGGVVNGAAISRHRSAIEVLDYNPANKAENLSIDKVRVRRWSATGSPGIGFFCTPKSAIVNQIMAGSPNGSPGAHGGPGSLCFDSVTGRVWRQNGAANTKSWVMIP